MESDEQFQLGQRVLSDQSFAQWLAMSLTTFESGRADMELLVRSELLQQHGFVAGGVVCSIADNALTFAGGSVLGPHVLTSEFKINFLRPARGPRLVARARVVHAGRRQAVCQCEVLTVTHDGHETLCALAQGTVVIKPDAP